MPSAVVAAVAVGRAAESTACTWAEVLEAGTAMVAVMTTEAAVTAMVTAEASTPASSATLLWREEVSAKSLTLPLAVIVSTTGGGSGGGAEGGGGGGREGGGAEGGGGGEAGGGEAGDGDNGGGGVQWAESVGCSNAPEPVSYAPEPVSSS